METKAASVSRTGSFRKRALEQRVSLDMNIDSPPIKYERTPSETDMELTPSSAKLPSKSFSSGTNAMLDEIEVHFQRSLAQAKQQAQHSGVTPSTSHTSPTTSSHTHRQFVDAHPQISVEKTPHSLGVTNTRSSSLTEPELSRYSTCKSLENEQHRIILTLNHAASATSPPTVSTVANSNMSTANSLRSVDHTVSSKSAVPHIKASNFVTIPVTQANIFANPLGLNNVSATQSPQFHTLPALSLASHVVKPPDSLLANMQGGAILNSGGTIISAQVLQQLLVQQSLLQQGSNALQLVNSPASLSLVPSSAQKLVTMSAPLGPRMSSTVVSVTTTQPTPSVTSSLLSSQQMSPVAGGGGQMLSPLVLPKMFDQTSSQHLMTGTSGGSPMIFLSSSGSVPFVQPQPFVLVNPNDLSTFQHPQQGMNLVGSGIIPNPGGGGGLILLSPGPAGTSSFNPPLINLGGATFPNTMQQLYVHPGSPSPAIAPPISNQPSTPKKITPLTTSSLQKIPPLKNLPDRRTSLDSISPGADDSDDVMLTPASVEDHFAKALGEEWSKLQNQEELSQVIQSTQNQYTVAS